MCQSDNTVFGIIDDGNKKTVHVGRSDHNIDPFIFEELSLVFACPHEGHQHQVEVRDEKNQVIKPYEMRGSEIYLSPAFFGRRWSLWVDSRFHLDLSLQWWKQDQVFRGEPVSH